MSFIYPYVGPAEVLRNSHHAPQGQPVRSARDIRDYVSEDRASHSEGTTFVVGIDRLLRLAPRRSEHVACAGRPEVLAAGEMRFAVRGEQIMVVEVSNQSTGFCPDVDCWNDIERALTFEGVTVPRGFTRPIDFRRCPRCAEINLVKDSWFVCVFCDADLPREWNVSARTLLVP
jgi:hypothetical protein